MTFEVAFTRATSRLEAQYSSSARRPKSGGIIRCQKQASRDWS